MSERPEVAVVVGSYGRREYLLSAVRSVLAQTVPRDCFEVVVTKSFADPEIDRFLATHRVSSRRDDDPRIGSWLLNAVALTRAPYIAFLDDDDEFEPDRLARVLDVFRADPTLGFYRNRVCVIDRQGDTVPSGSWRKHELDAFFDSRGPVTISPTEKKGLATLGFDQSRVSFNSSTMVVRRELFDGESGAVFARTQLPDLALFVLASLSPFGLYLDDRRLTRYRYYGGNVTHGVPWLRHACESNRDLAEAARAHGNAELALRLYRDSRHYDRLYRSGTIVERVGAGADRREVARLAGDYLRFLGRNPSERSLTLDVWAAEVYASSYLIVPAVARRLSVRRTALRSA